MSSTGPLFACTRCNSRHPFEELSSGQQLCRECRGAYPIVKCTYCRTEFQQESKSSLNTICKKCEQNVKLYGKPSACEYCNIIAAFIGNKCQRCTNSEKRYGSPLPCEQCKQRCAFDRKDPESRKKVDGKLLCWLCTLSYKRALAKAKQNDTSIRHTSIHVHHKSRSSSSKQKGESRSHHRTHHSSSSSDLMSNSTGGTISKKPRLETPNGGLTGLSVTLSSSITDSSMMDIGNSDHVVAVTQLREQLATLHKQRAKDKADLLEKDKKIAELKSHSSRIEREWREKLQTQQKSSEEKTNNLQQKIAQLLKQIASLSKANKKNNNSNNNNNSNSNLIGNNHTPNDSPTASIL